jgi:hypothetical protein
LILTKQSKLTLVSSRIHNKGKRDIEHLSRKCEAMSLIPALQKREREGGKEREREGKKRKGEESKGKERKN